MGRRDQFRRRRCGAGPRVRHQQRRLLDQRVSSRWPAARRDPADLRSLAGVHRRRHRPARPRCGRRAIDRARRGERAAGCAARAAARRRRLRPRCAVERRLPPQRDGGAHRPRGGLLQRHARGATGAGFGGEVRLSVPGTALSLAAQSARRACVGSAPGRVRHVPAESRSDREFGARARGHQLTSPARWRAMTALLLLMPGTPMLFQGQEFSASTPFLYFADFEADLAEGVRKGRCEFLTQFPSVADLERWRGVLAHPGDVATFERCWLDFTERDRHADAYALHADLLRLRREEAAFCAQQPGGVDGAVLSASALALRFFTPDHLDDRVLIVNLGRGFDRTSIAEPLLAPPQNTDWIIRWSSEDPAYGGTGTPDIFPD